MINKLLKLEEFADYIKLNNPAKGWVGRVRKMIGL